MQRIILDSNKKKLGFDNLNYLISPEEFAADLTGLKIPLFHQNSGRFWFDFNKVGTVRSVDNVLPVNGNVDLSKRYFTQTEINTNFLRYPKTSSNNDNFRLPLINPETKDVHYINLGDMQRLKTYVSPDNTIAIEDDQIYLNVTNIKSESEHPYSEGVLPLDIEMDEEYNEVTDVIVNGKIIPREFYRLTSKKSIKILENLMNIFDNTPITLYVCVKGIKFFK